MQLAGFLWDRLDQWPTNSKYHSRVDQLNTSPYVFEYNAQIHSAPVCTLLHSQLAELCVWAAANLPCTWHPYCPNSGKRSDFATGGQVDIGKIKKKKVRHKSQELKKIS